MLKRYYMMEWAQPCKTRIEGGFIDKDPIRFNKHRMGSDCGSFWMVSKYLNLDHLI